MKNTVLVVDDDELPMMFYREALKRQGYDVHQCRDPDSTLEFARQKAPAIAAIVLDIMMDPGVVYSNQNTNQGLRTGVLLYRDLRQVCPDVPVVVLTNVVDTETLREFEGQQAVRVIQKIDCPPLEFASLLSSMISDTHASSSLGP